MGFKLSKLEIVKKWINHTVGERMKKISIILIFIIFSTVFSFKGWAAANDNLDKVAVVLVIDNSGSMNDSDPLLNRFTSSQMVLDLLTELDYLSILTFSDEVQTLFPMGELSGDKLQTASRSLLNVPKATGYTDYLKALDQADQSLSGIPEGVRKFIIFLTDGAPEIRDKTQDFGLYMTSLREKIISLGNKGAPIYTVGFGTSNSAYLTEISDLTRGMSLHGASSDVAISFFKILQELKNRYTLLDSKVTSAKLESLQFTVDEYTSRVTVLVHDEAGGGKVKMQDAEGKEVTPQFQADRIFVYHLNENPDKAEKTYSLLTNLNGSVRAVRDTKTKLWINDPLNNSQLPFESKVIAKVSQTGTPGTDVLFKAKLTKNGVPVTMETVINNTGSEYEISLGNLPQTGQYELEVSFNKTDRLIAKTSSRFFLKNIPVLKSDVLKDDGIWIQNENKKITAYFEKSGTRVTRDLAGVEVALEVGQGADSKSLRLFDDGKPESGDVIAGDGIYSGWLKLATPGEFTSSLSARGVFQNDPFFLAGNPKIYELKPFGIIEITLPASAVPNSSGKSEVDVWIKNQSSYAEEVSILVNEEVMTNPPVKVAPGETVVQKITVPINSQAKDLKFDFKTMYQVTQIKASSTLVSLNKTDVSNQGGLPKEIFFIGGAVLAAGVLFFFIRQRKPHQLTMTKLQGDLVYTKPETGEVIKLPLSGTSPMEFSIGPERKTSNHIETATEPSFRFKIYPIHSDKGTAVVELKCAPPGSVLENGRITTSALLSNRDVFEMNGLGFRYELSQADFEGQDVLTGKI